MKNELLTAQEHKLFGSNVDEKYSANPYTPIAVQDGTIPINECNNQRQSEGKLSNIVGIYWGQKYLRCDMSLEPLDLDKNSDNYGKTLRDPALIKLDYPLENMEDFSNNFPNKRENKPRVLLEDE